MKKLLIASAILIITTFLISSSYAQLLWDPEGVPLRKTTHIGWQILSTKNSLGEIFIVWMDSREGRSKMYGKKYDQNGASLWPEDIVILDNEQSNDYGQMLICPTSDDGFVIVWGFHEFPESIIRANKVDGDGNILWGAWGVEVGNYMYEEGGTTFFDVVSDGTGGCIPVWFNEFPSNCINMYAKRLLSDGSTAPGWDENGNVIKEDVLYPTNYYCKITCSDEANGLIASWQEYYSTNRYGIFAQRIDGEGNLQWGVNGLLLCSFGSAYCLPRLSKDGSGGAFFVWTDNRNPQDYDLFMQRVDGGGNILWAENGIPLCQQAGSQLEAKIEYDGLGGAVIAWEDHRYSSFYSDLYCQRIDEAGEILWAPEGVILSTASYDQTNVIIDCDGAGGLTAIWDYWNGGGYSHSDVYIQSVSADGRIFWQNNGIMLSGGENNDVGGKTVISIDEGEALFAWEEDRDNRSGLYLQLVDESGNFLLPLPGAPVVEALAGSAFSPVLLDLPPDRFLCVYGDSRWDLQIGVLIYYQIFDREANIMLLENGVPICADTEGEQENIRAVATSDGNTIITWEDERISSYDRRIFAQKIDAEGNLLWDAAGIQLSEFDDRQCFQYCCADDSDGAYVVWMAYMPSNQIFIQHIDSEGGLIFGNNGLIVTSIVPDAENIGVAPDGENGVIIVYEDFGSEHIYAMRVLPSGEIDWDNPVYVLSYRQYAAVCIPSHEGGAIIAWEEERYNWDMDIFAQKVDNNGNMLWRTNGTPVILADNNQRYPRMVEDEEGYVYFAWQDAREASNLDDIYCQRLSPEGVMQFQEEGILICQTDEDIDDIAMLADGSGGVFISWEDEREYSNRAIYATHLDSEGQIADPVWAANGNPVIDEAGGQYDPTMLPDGFGGAVIVWGDCRPISGEDIYMQRINDYVTSVETANGTDVLDGFALRQNYPNPFNPTTAISCQLPAASHVELIVYDVIGREVARMVEGFQPAGVYQRTFDPSGLSSGIYFARLQADGFSQTRKLLFIK